jgi:hypothetical protein
MITVHNKSSMGAGGSCPLSTGAKNVAKSRQSLTKADAAGVCNRAERAALQSRAHSVQVFNRPRVQAKGPVLSLDFRPVELLRTRSLHCARHENARTEKQTKICAAQIPDGRHIFRTLGSSCARGDGRHYLGSHRAFELRWVHDECGWHHHILRHRHPFGQHRNRRFRKCASGQLCVADFDPDEYRNS